MEKTRGEPSPTFSQPIRQITAMLVACLLVGIGAWAIHDEVLGILKVNPWFNGFIVGVFLLGVVTCFWQVVILVQSVSWIEDFVRHVPGHDNSKPPRLLAPLASLLRSRGSRMQISSSSSRSILDSVSTRIDEARDITRYLANLLVFLGLLGTFFGLATSVPAVVETIRSLAPQEGESGLQVFEKLMSDNKSTITYSPSFGYDLAARRINGDAVTLDLSRLRIAGVGGAPCALAILETWTARGVPLVQGWGMTETSPAGTMLDAADAIRKLGSAGKAMMHTAIRVVDDEGRDVPAGGIGELLIKGPNITPGYWNNPAATERSFTDGWLHTGDAARLDEEGFVYIVDRWKDMYISGGENVYPAEVENVLFQLAAVADAAIIGVPSERWGEVGMAIIVRKPEQDLAEGDVIQHCLARLAKFKVPQSVAFVDALPRNATGKVLKRELRTQFVGENAPAIS